MLPREGFRSSRCYAWGGRRTMTATTMPRQYAFLFGLLRDCSGVYTDQLASLSADHHSSWNPMTARFEVDAYFAFKLSASLVHLKHDRHVWEDMCSFSEVALSAIHAEKVSCDDLADVIAARAEEYGRIANRCGESGEAPTIPLVKSLRRHIMASSRDDRVRAESPLVIGDAFQEFSLLLGYLRIDLLYAGPFSCVLKHIFQRTRDVRTLSEDELVALAQAGQTEAAAIAAQIPDLTSLLASPRKQPWWQFWR